MNNSNGWAISQKLALNGFGWIKEISQFNKGFVRSYNEESDKEYFLEVDIQYAKKLHELHKDLLFLTEIMKIFKVKTLVANFHDKK